MSGLALALSACVSAVTPTNEVGEVNNSVPGELRETSLQLSSSAETASSGEQLLVKSADGEVIAVPVPSPQISPAPAVETATPRATALISPAADVSTPELPAPEPLSETASIVHPAPVVPIVPGAPIVPGVLGVTPIPEPTPEIAAPHPSPTDPLQTQSSQLVGTEITPPGDAPAQTTELALATIQEKPRPSNYFEDNERDGSGVVVSTPRVTASESATRKQATAELNRPGLLSRLFRRPTQNVGPNNRANAARNKSATNSISQRSSISFKPSTGSLAALPGVKSNDAIFGIKRKTKNGEKNVQLASVTSLGRLSPSSLRVQHSGVNVSCIRPEVIKLLKFVERRYGKKPIVTSGYRSPASNRKAGGVRNSLHIVCSAVDIQVEGVSKWNLAKFLRSIPGRGGVGTYCRTKSVHIDTGTKRDWNQTCRRKSKRRRT